MFDNLTKEESLQAIDERIVLMNQTMRAVLDNSLTTQQIRETIDTYDNEIKELWYHIYDLDGTPYTRE